MKTPYLIQRCKLTKDNRLIYDYMGSTEYEIGDQAKSLKRMFAIGICQYATTVSVGDKQVAVYVVAPEGFSFEEYQQHLQKSAEGRLYLKEGIGFGDAVKNTLGIKMSWRSYAETNVWFDFENDVLWTLSQKEADHLVLVLEGIKAKWAEKK